MLPPLVMRVHLFCSDRPSRPPKRSYGPLCRGMLLHRDSLTESPSGRDEQASKPGGAFAILAIFTPGSNHAIINEQLVLEQ
jgi:hypothetical protein